MKRYIVVITIAFMLAVVGCAPSPSGSDGQAPRVDAPSHPELAIEYPAKIDLDGIGTIAETNQLTELPSHWRNISDDIPGMLSGGLESSEKDFEIIYGVGEEMATIMRSGPPGMVEFHALEIYGQQFECGVVFGEMLTIIFVDEGPACFSADVSNEADANYVVELVARHRDELLGIDLSERAQQEALAMQALSDRGQEALIERNNLTQLPDHWSHEASQGIDTAVGRIVSSEKDFEFRYDIGMGAGNFAKGRRRDARWFTNAEMYGEIFEATWGKDDQLYITFEDEGPANFMTTVSTQDDVDYAVELIARHRNALLGRDLKEAGRKQREWMEQMQKEMEAEIEKLREEEDSPSR